MAARERLENFLTWWPYAAGLLGIGVVVAGLWGARTALGVLVGGAWNLASLWCLNQLLEAWLGPQRSTRRVVGWLLVKFPLLYLLAFGVWRASSVSLLGFGIGFTLVLIVALGGLFVHAQHRMGPSRVHGR